MSKQNIIEKIKNLLISNSRSDGFHWMIEDDVYDKVATEIANIYPDINSAIELVADERRRQIEAEGWSLEADTLDNKNEELALAAACYSLPDRNRFVANRSMGGNSVTPDFWPWLKAWWKPTPNDRIRELVKAGALIVAEIERLQRIEEIKNKKK